MSQDYFDAIRRDDLEACKSLTRQIHFYEVDSLSRAIQDGAGEELTKWLCTCHPEIEHVAYELFGLTGWLPPLSDEKWKKINITRYTHPDIIEEMRTRDHAEVVKRVFRYPWKTNPSMIKVVRIVLNEENASDIAIFASESDDAGMVEYIHSRYPKVFDLRTYAQNAFLERKKKILAWSLNLVELDPKSLFRLHMINLCQHQFSVIIQTDDIREVAFIRECIAGNYLEVKRMLSDFPINIRAHGDLAFRFSARHIAKFLSRRIPNYLVTGKLCVVVDHENPGPHWHELRPFVYVSVMNLASWRDIEARVGEMKRILLAKSAI